MNPQGIGHRAKGKQNKAWTLGLLLALCASLFAGGAYAKGTSSGSADFLKVGVGGRGLAMGEAQASAANDATALYWNPALLSRLNQSEAVLAHNALFEDIAHDTLYTVLPTNRAGTFGVGATFVRYGDITGYDAYDARTKEFTASDTALTLGWGLSLARLLWMEDLETGLNIKMVQSKIDNDSASTLTADVGLGYEVKEGWLQRFRLGLAYQNAIGGLTYVTKEGELPRAIRVGVSRPFLGDGWIVALDAVSPSDGDLYYNLGTEYKLFDIVALRVGYTSQSKLDSGLTYGVGLGNERLHLDYAFVPAGDLGNTHRVSVGFRFGARYKKSQVETQIRQAFEKAEARYAQGYLVDSYVQSSQVLVIAPWYKPAQRLMERIQKEVNEMGDISRKEQLQMEIDEHFSVGQSHFERDELIPARKEFEAILALKPGHEGANNYLKRIDDRFKALVADFYERGMRYFAAGDYAKARDAFEKVMVMEPDHPDAGDQLARTRELLAASEKAAAARKKLELSRPIYNAALEAFQQKQYTEALQRFNAVMSMDPDNVEAKRYQTLCSNILSKEYLEEGNKQAKAGDWEKANEAFKKSLQLKPDSGEAREALKMTEAQLTQKRKDESESLYKRGLEAFLLGKKDMARDLWKKALQIYPQNAEAKRGMERLEKSNGDGTR